MLLPDHMLPLIGDNWSGELTYLNYGSDEMSTIPVRMIIEAPKGNSIPFAIKYPGEEDKNANDSLKVSSDGTKFDKKQVIENVVLPSGTRRIVTQGRGKDDNRSADIQIIYEISDDLFKMRKMVKFEGQAWIKRNEYVLRR